MIPTQIRISGFLSYHQPVDLDFRSFDLACITGANGAGKSSLLDAMTWVLFGQARRKDDTIINSYSDQAEVIFDFLYEGSPYRIQRIKPKGKTTLLEFYVQHPDGQYIPLTEDSLRKTEESIQKTLRLDYETFTNASFFLQGKADQFAQQRPGERKRILTNILGLEVWESYREAAAGRRKKLENEQILVESRLSEIQSELDKENERRSRLKLLEDNLSQASQLRKSREEVLGNLRRLVASLEEQHRMVDLWFDQLQVARLRFEERIAQLNTRKQEVQTYHEQLGHQEEIESAYQKWQTARLELVEWDRIAANFHQVETRRARPLTAIETERVRLETEYENLRVQNRQFMDLRETLPELQNEENAARNAVEELHVRLEQRVELNTEQLRLIDQLTEVMAENKRLKTVMEELKARIDRLKEAEGVECPLCGQPLDQDDRIKLVSELENQGRQLGDSYRANLDEVRQGEDRRKAIQAEIAALQQLETILRQSQRNLDQISDRKKQIVEALQTWDSGGALRLLEFQNRLAKNDYALESRAELASIDAELHALGYDTEAHDTVRRTEQEGHLNEERYRALEKARASLGPLEREISELEKQLHEDSGHVSSLETSYQEAVIKYEKDAAGIPDLNQIENEVLLLQEQENRLRMQVGGAVQELEVLKVLRVRQDDFTQQRRELGVQIGRLKKLEMACGKDGVPALLIEQALPEIEFQANQILDRLTDGGMSIRFATLKDFKDKNREDKKETLDIIISDAVGSREYELFSGGEAFRVNFAIRLALSRVLAQRAGARLQSLVIDEGFGSQDSEGRQRLVEAINLVKSDFAKILVITHLEELKDAFPARIEVEKTATGSRLEVVI